MVPLAAAAAAGAFFFGRAALSRKEAVVSVLPAAPVSAPTRVELVLASGDVRLGSVDVGVGQGPLEAGQHVSVGRGRACLNVDPSIDICLDEGTEVALDSLLEDDVRIRVVRGTAVAALAPRAPGHTFSLVGGDVSATARGTLFAIGHSPTEGTTNVVVVEGKLEVSGVESSVDVDIATGERFHIEPADLTRLPPKGAGAATAQSAATLLDAARRELARGGGKAALPLYQRLRTTYPASPEAFTVLVTIGQIELDLRSPSRALSAFDAYLRRGGPLAPEALAGKIRALRALGKATEERATIDEYLTKYPGGFEAQALKKRIEALSPP